MYISRIFIQIAGDFCQMPMQSVSALCFGNSRDISRPSQKQSPRRPRHRALLLTAEMRIRTTCPESLHGSETAGNRTHELLIAGLTPYIISTHTLLLIHHEYGQTVLSACRSTRSCTDSHRNTLVHSTVSPTCLAADLSVLQAPS